MSVHDVVLALAADLPVAVFEKLTLQQALAVAEDTKPGDSLVLVKAKLMGKIYGAVGRMEPHEEDQFIQEYNRWLEGEEHRAWREIIDGTTEAF